MENLVNSLVFLKFDLKDWAAFYNNLPNLAKNTSLTLIEVSNYIMDNQLKDPKKSLKTTKTKKKTKKKKKVIPKKEIIKKQSLLVKEIEMNIEASGDFVNMIRFIYLLENKREMVKIKSIHIDGKILQLLVEIYGARL